MSAGRSLPVTPSKKTGCRRRELTRNMRLSPNKLAVSPTGKRPDPDALFPTAPAAADLRIPSGAELIKALMRGIFLAIMAEAPEPIGSIVRRSLAAPSELRH